MRSDGAVQLVRTHHFVRIPAAEHRGHHALHIVQILFRFERVIDAVVSGFVEEFLVAELGIVPEMSAPSRFDQSMRHQRAGGNDGIHYATIDQLGNHQALLGHGHRACEGHDDAAVSRRAPWPPARRRLRRARRPVNAVFDMARTRSSME